MSISLYAAEAQARDIVNGYTAGAASIGWCPGSCAVLTPIQANMVADIAACFGVHSYSAQAVLTVISTNLTGHVAADVLLSMIPGIGWAIKSGVAAGITKAAGEIIIEYFKERSPYR
jgi:uncharacterized protein (DUF697 family)